MRATTESPSQELGRHWSGLDKDHDDGGDHQQDTNVLVRLVDSPPQRWATFGVIFAHANDIAEASTINAIWKTEEPCNDHQNSVNLVPAIIHTMYEQHFG